MMTFLFASLGSSLFWTVYFAIGLFIGVFTLKLFAKRTVEIIKQGSRSCGDPFVSDIIVVVIFHVILWPISSLMFIIYSMCKFIVIPVLIKLLQFVINTIPDIDIKNKKE